MVSETEGPKAMFDFFKEDRVPISITRDNSKVQTRKTWNEYMRRFWVEDNFIGPHHPGYNPFDLYQDNWKAEMTNVMIDSNIYPRGSFHVMQHIADLHNHCANQ